MSRENITYRIYNMLILVGILVLIILLLIINFGSEKSPILDSILNFGHLPLFGAASLVLIWVLNRRQWPVYEHSYYIVSISAMVALGIATEIFQSLTPDRFFGISDIIHDALGALTFLILAYPSSGRSVSRIKKYKALAVFTIFLATVPIHIAVIDSWHMYRNFPMLNSFESRLEMKRLSEKDNRYKQSQKHATHGMYALETRLSPGEYPGIALEMFYGDWRGYNSFSFDVYLEGNKPLPITVRIDDILHNQEYSDRFNKSYILSPGANNIDIGLPEVRNALRARTMDVQHINSICIFSHRLRETRVLYFDNIRLVK